jgi:hypothetical protein
MLEGSVRPCKSENDLQLVALVVIDRLMDGCIGGSS